MELNDFQWIAEQCRGRTYQFALGVGIQISMNILLKFSKSAMKIKLFPTLQPPDID